MGPGLAPATVPCATCGKPKIANRATNCRNCYKAAIALMREEAQPKLTVADMDPEQLTAYRAIMSGRHIRLPRSGAEESFQVESDIEARRMVEIATERGELASEIAWHTAPVRVESNGKSSLFSAMATVL